MTLTKAVLQLLCRMRLNVEWREGLLPLLEEIKSKHAYGKSYPVTIDELAIAEVRRVAVLDTIDGIIDEVENAEKSLTKHKTYAGHD